MDEQNHTTRQEPLINLLFDDGLQNALPRIAGILMNAAMLLERETHIGAAPYQRGIERNGYANGFKSRTYLRQLFAHNRAVIDLVERLAEPEGKAQGGPRLAGARRTVEVEHAAVALWAEVVPLPDLLHRVAHGDGTQGGGDVLAGGVKFVL